MRTGKCARRCLCQELSLLEWPRVCAKPSAGGRLAVWPSWEQLAEATDALAQQPVPSAVRAASCSPASRRSWKTACAIGLWFLLHPLNFGMGRMGGCVRGPESGPHGLSSLPGWWTGDEWPPPRSRQRTSLACVSGRSVACSCFPRDCNDSVSLQNTVPAMDGDGAKPRCALCLRTSLHYHDCGWILSKTLSLLAQRPGLSDK